MINKSGVLTILEGFDYRVDLNSLLRIMVAADFTYILMYLND